MPNHEIVECCMQALYSGKPLGQPPLQASEFDTRMIKEISRLSSALQIQFVHKIVADIAAILNWNEVFNTKGLKTHQLHYGIVIHGIPTKTIPPLKLIDPKLTLNIEFQNNIPKETITKISVLQQQKNCNLSSSQNSTSELLARHYSIVVFFNNYNQVNEIIKNGLCFEYNRHRVEWFTPQFQLKQCYNAKGLDIW
jgi:hypothetical protein